jgi:hypothetical protein
MIGAYLIDRVIIVTTTEAAFGEPGTETTETVKARIEWRTKKVLNFVGEEVVSEKQVMIRPRPLNHSQKIRIGAFDWPIIGISRAADFRERLIEVAL